MVVAGCRLSLLSLRCQTQDRSLFSFVVAKSVSRSSNIDNLVSAGDFFAAVCCIASSMISVGRDLIKPCAYYQSKYSS